MDLILQNVCTEVTNLRKLYLWSMYISISYTLLLRLVMHTLNIISGMNPDVLQTPLDKHFYNWWIRIIVFDNNEKRMLEVLHYKQLLPVKQSILFEIPLFHNSWLEHLNYFVFCQGGRLSWIIFIAIVQTK